MKGLLTKKLILTYLVVLSTLFISATSYASTAAARGNSFAKDASEKGTKLYFLYGDASAGTKFKEKIASSPIPFDKRYSDLSPELQARIKAGYGGLKESETPPFPAEGNERLYRSLIKAHRGIGREGDLMAVALIKDDGSVSEIKVYKAPNQAVATMLNYILANTEFDPGTCDGKPCTMEYLFETSLGVSPSNTR